MRAAPHVILLVEDDLGHAELIRANLELGNVPQEIEHVTDGQQALDFLRRRSSVLVLLDLSLPRVDGIEFLRRLKSRPESRRHPVLVFAAEDDPQLIARCYELGCSLYFQKPALLEDFLGTVSRLAGLIQAVSVP